MPDGPVTLGWPDRSGDCGGALPGSLGGDHRCVGNGSLGAGVDHPGHEECSRCAGCQGAEGEQALPRPPGDPAVKGIDPGGERRRQMVLYHHALCWDAAPVDRHQAVYQVLTGDCPAGEVLVRRSSVLPWTGTRLVAVLLLGFGSGVELATTAVFTRVPWAEEDRLPRSSRVLP